MGEITACLFADRSNSIKKKDDVEEEKLNQCP